MTIRIAGPGAAINPPQNLYPSELFGAPYDAATNYIGLSPGDAIYIQAGDWEITVGEVSFLQYPDPVTGIWRNFPSIRGQSRRIFSNGFNARIANLTGCPVSAVVAGGGSGFTAGTAAITANVGGSTWQPVVGGALSVSTITAAGANYGVTPLLYIPAPPAPGIPATGHVVLTSGSVTSVVLDNVGAGYISAPQAVILPSQFDPNFGTTSITPASVTLVLNAALSGAITGALMKNQGASLATLSALTLTAAGGAGTGATLNPVVCQAVVSASVVAGGGGWGNATNPAAVQTTGGTSGFTSAIGNPAVELTNARPRQALIGVTTSGAGALSAPVVIDSGLFYGTPTPVIVPGGTLPTTLASIALTMGGVVDTVLLQPV